MDTVNTISKTISKNMPKTVTKVLKHKQVSLVITLLIALYAGLAAPALPNVLVRAADSIPGKLVFLFIIAYMASKDIPVALMIAVAFVVTLHVANKRTTELYMNSLERFDGLEVAPPPVPAVTTVAADCVDACKDAGGTDSDCDAECGTLTNTDANTDANTFANFTEDFSVYPDSGAKYAYSLF